jgi:two-component system heavy metal sensor histidine kinase CusS
VRALALLLPGTAAAALAVWAAARAEDRPELAAAIAAFALVSLVLQARGARARARDERKIAELDAALAGQRRFVAQAAHELRGPITVVSGQLELALRRPREAEDYREAIGEALGSARDLRALADELLDLGRAGSPGPFEPTSVARAARGAARLVHAEAERARVAIDLRIEDALVSGSGGELMRLLRNLLENAVRHSPARGRVVVEAAAVGSFVEIAVGDEGAGVPEGERARIFEPFFRGARERAGGGGAGLGLSIVRAIARAHGGDVHLDTAPRDLRGARFVVRLPLLCQAAAPATDLAIGATVPATADRAAA